jgi:hypothetical protein
MTLFASFDLFEPDPKGLSLAELLSHWDRQPRQGAGGAYVYAFRDAVFSVFYVGKGVGHRAYDKQGHRHGRLGYYIANFLSDTYSVDVLKSDLSNEDAEALEAWLIEGLVGQLVNWAGNLGSLLTSESVARIREGTTTLRARAREQANKGNVEDSISLCREALAHLSEWERNQHDAEVRELERLSTTSLAARIDLHRVESDYIAHAPVLACEILSDLTRCLCDVGRPEEARIEVEAFTERYPRGSFRSYEFFDDRYARHISVAVTKREQATLRRIEKALARR